MCVWKVVCVSLEVPVNVEVVFWGAVCACTHTHSQVTHSAIHTFFVSLPLSAASPSIFFLLTMQLEMFDLIDRTSSATSRRGLRNLRQRMPCAR